MVTLMMPLNTVVWKVPSRHCNLEVVCTALIHRAVPVPHKGNVCHGLVPHLHKSPARLTMPELPDGVRGLPQHLVTDNYVSITPILMARMALSHLSVSR